MIEYPPRFSLYENWQECEKENKKLKKLLALYKEWVSMAYSPFDRDRIMKKIEKEVKVK